MTKSDYISKTIYRTKKIIDTKNERQINSIYLANLATCEDS